MQKLTFVVAAMVLASAAGGVAAQSAACERYPVGQDSYECSCTGTESGSVWGSGPYTADSAICVAARHAGVIDASGGQVRVVQLPGQAAYAGTIQNGVQTSTWGSYGTSYAFEGMVEMCQRFPVGQGSYTCHCAGDETGSVWGSGPYTADSNLCVAARHAGVISTDGGAITAIELQGLGGYTGSGVNGVTTSNWGSYGTSVVFDSN